jgi:hypothetical protein
MRQKSALHVGENQQRPAAVPTAVRFVSHATVTALERYLPHATQIGCHCDVVSRLRRDLGLHLCRAVIGNSSLVPPSMAIGRLLP